MLVVIASLIVIVGIQFASTAFSSPTKESAVSPLARRVAKLEKTVKKMNVTLNTVANIAACLTSADAGPFGVTRFTAPGPTLPSGGYLDLTPSGGSSTYISVRVDPKCLGSSSKTPQLKKQFQLKR